MAMSFAHVGTELAVDRHTHGSHALVEPDSRGEVMRDVGRTNAQSKRPQRAVGGGVAPSAAGTTPGNTMGGWLNWKRKSASYTRNWTVPSKP